MATKTNQNTQPGLGLSEQGLLFETNRTLLHPLGMALASDSKGNLSLLQTDDPEGFVYNEEAFQSGSQKLQQFMNAQAQAIFASREQELSYIIQEFPNPDIFREGSVAFTTHDWQADTPEGEEPPTFSFAMKADDAQELVALIFGQQLHTFIDQAGTMETGRLYELARRTGVLLEES